MNRPLRVWIEARMPPGVHGGVQQVVIGLAYGLARLGGGDGEEYLFAVDSGSQSWLAEYVRPPSRIVRAEPPKPPFASRLSMLRHPARWSLPHDLLLPPPPPSDGAAERERADVIHFPWQHAYATDVPTIYHPHDLQHLHLPRFFTWRQRLARERLYRYHCGRAALVAVASTWGREDLLRQYGLPAERVAVVPLAPANEAYDEPTVTRQQATRRKFGLPELFCLYPAQTWAHKNHAGLLEAAALLKRERGLTVPLVFSGHRNAHGERLVALAGRIGLGSSVHFLGFVTPEELQCLYRMARVVVIPSMFEAASFPLWEAQLAGVPVACSRVTSLPQQAGDSALLFDPTRSDEIASAMYRLWTDAGLRYELVQRGRARVARFTWAKTARHFRAHYRRLAGQQLSEEDRTLRAAPPEL